MIYPLSHHVIELK